MGILLVFYQYNISRAWRATKTLVSNFLYDYTLLNKHNIDSNCVRCFHSKPLRWWCQKERIGMGIWYDRYLVHFAVLVQSPMGIFFVMSLFSATDHQKPQKQRGIQVLWFHYSSDIPAISTFLLGTLQFKIHYINLTF